ncbi:ipa protein [Karstenula rhodostoma CBS 690.94]|uniref:Ipa protein n=1 Tax=Karstenula rhodostoma CBS 690.94 TaxID=1392251 RepID=A0A9P4PEH3_9PLEO|nr:ipa protein [Karstenula rhodostoma CBS 690.94]
MDEAIKALHRDLTRKYKRHGPRVEQMWRSLPQAQRAEALKAGSVNVLKSPTDASLGNVYKFMPEWNLRDITAPSSDFLLDMLKHRATTSLQEQYKAGVNGGLGDHAHIVDMMNKKNLELTDTHKVKDGYTLFFDEESYGKSVEVTARGNKKEFLTAMAPAIRAQLVVPQSTGHLILLRQQYLLQSLNIIIEDILEAASTTRDQKTRPKNPAEAATAALSDLSFHAAPKKVELADLLKSSLDRRSSLEEYIDLICTEPTVLAYETNIWFFTRPELVADEKGRVLPAYTDDYISAALFDAINNAVKSAAVWNYIHRLTALLHDAPDKQLRAILLQELSKVCVLEYNRAQGMFRRSVATGSGGNKWFKRMSDKQKNGTIRIAMKRDPESLTVENPQLHYMLRLCQTDTTWSKAAEWLQKLEDLHRAHPLEKDKMDEREFNALGELAVVVTFIRSLSSAVPLPALNSKKGQSFIMAFHTVEEEFSQLKIGLDLSDFAIPIDNLLEPGMADGALKALDAYVVEKIGTKLGFLYQDLVDDCVSKIHDQHEQQKAKSKEVKMEYAAPTAPVDFEERVQQRRLKEKTRPAHSSIYEITPQVSTRVREEPTYSQQTFKVKESTFAALSTLLSSSSAARGSITWDAFTAAMADLKFSIIPKFGSVFTFRPSEKDSGQKDVTIHRPHQSRIEGVKLLQISKRLKRVLGWDETTFTTE